jgi:hypothetical protein
MSTEPVYTQEQLEEIEKIREEMEVEGLRPGIHEIRVGVGDAQIEIPPIAETADSDAWMKSVGVRVPSPVGEIKAEIDHGDTIHSVGLMLLLTTGLALQSLLVIWGYFKFKYKYSVERKTE